MPISNPNALNNTNDLVYRIAARAKELADDSMLGLRLIATDSDHPSKSGLAEEFRGISRGSLIEGILQDEFCEEFPGDIEWPK